MKIESEKTLEKKLRVEIEKRGGRCFKFAASYFAGVPDRICLLPGGVIFFAEVKTTNQKPTKLQLSVHKILTDLGFKVFVIDNSEMIIQILNEKGTN